MIPVKIKLLDATAKVPQYAKLGDAGVDLHATHVSWDENENIVYNTGIALEIPEGFCGLIFPRSSVSKFDLTLANSVGVIDSGYRGEIIVKFKPTAVLPNHLPKIYNVGDRIAQLMIMPVYKIDFEEVSELSDSDRGEGGFGSTGT